MAPLVFWITDKAHATLDWSQRLYFLFDRPGGALGVPQAKAAAPRRWYFIDLNGGFCRPAPESGRCPPVLAHTDQDALAMLLRNVLAQGPRLVVLDVLIHDLRSETSAARCQNTGKSTDHCQAKDGQLLADLLASARVPVLLSWFPSSGRSDDATLSAENDTLLYSLDGSNAPSHVRYLPAIKALTGPSALYLLPTARVALRDRVLDLPTIAFGAALVLASSTGEQFKTVEAFSRDANKSRCELLLSFDCDEYETTRRIFSFPPRPPHSDEVYLSRSKNPYYARIIPDLDDPFLGRLGRGLMSDAVIVIGNSDPAAGDQTWSALGGVSGAEIIMNDIRQYLVSPPEPERGFLPGLFAWLYSERYFYCLSFVAILVTEILVDLRWPKVQRDTRETQAQTALSTAPSPAAHAAVHEFTWRHLVRAISKLGIEVILSFLLYGFAIHWQSLVDVVSPFFGGLVQALIETVHQIKKGLDALFEWLFERNGSSAAQSRSSSSD